ncbi:ankyrin repeat-containing domain protein [Mycena epipterygia]|nr:ankyrin repeat-containing domain protein [Mycena epipterygia]
MAEVLGLLATILQLVDTVAKAGTFIKDLHNAPKQQQQLLSEITSLQPLLTAFHDRLLNNSSSAAGEHIKDPLSAFEDTMKHCSSKLQEGGAFNRVSKPISWTLWNKKEAKEELDQVERFKSLLSTWLTMDIWDVGRQHNTILKSVEIVAQEQQHHINDEKREKILEWMSPLNSFQRQADIFSKWQSGTGSWLLASAKFKDWESGCGKTLWCRGMPGAGKTVLASLVVNHLESKSYNENIGVACIYLNYKEGEFQTLQNLLGCLWRQLVLGKSIPDAVHALYERHHERQTKLPLDEVRKTLVLSVTQYSKVYLIVDALDEYPEEQRTMLLQSLGEIGVNVMITSRPHIDPDSTTLPNLQIIEIQATENDMWQYINAQILNSNRLSKHVQTRPELSNEIRAKILSNVNGMFLLAKLHIDSLTTKNTVKAVREALHQLPMDLRHTYDEAMERIDHQGEDDKQLAYLTLMWVVNAKRPLSVGELQEALAIEPDTTALDPDNVLDISIILSVCAGLVTVDEEASVIRLIHYTTQDYLDSIQSQRFPNAQTAITSSYLTYLSFQEFSTLPTDGDEVAKLVLKHPLLEYSQYCLAHAVGQPEVDLQEMIISFLDRAPLWQDFWGYFLHEGSLVMPTDKGIWPTSPLCTSVACNLQTISSHLLAKGTPTETLSYAALVGAYSGHLQLVQLLLDHDADVNLVQGYFGTALHAASLQGHEAIVKLLLVHADVNIAGGEYKTALQAASSHGHEAVVRLLIQHGAVVNIVGGYFGTALQAASYEGNEAVIQLLLDHTVGIPNGAYINLQGGKYGTALQAAAFRGHEVVVRLLLDQGAEVNIMGGEFGTALQAASSEGHQLVVKLLLDHGANVNIMGGEFGTALQAASLEGHQLVVRLLLDHGADMNILGGEFGTALQAASYVGHEPVVRLLLDHGADMHTIGGYFGTSLQAAAFQGHELVVRLLLAKGADVNVMGGKHGTALQAASSQGHEGIIRLLLDHSADVNIIGGKFGTALQAASTKINQAMVQLLLNHGADVNIIGGENGTASQAASYEGHDEVVRLLIDNHANLNAQGGKY